MALRCWLDGGGRSTVVAWVALAVSCLVVVAAVRARAVRYVVLVCALAFAAALAHSGSLVSRATLLESAGPTTWSGTVGTDAVTGAFGTSVEVRLDAAPSGPVAIVSWPEGAPAPGYGQRVTLDGRLKARLRADASAEAFRRGEILSLRPWKVSIRGWAAPPLGWVASWRAGVLAALKRLGGAGAETLACMLFAAPPGPQAARVIENARTAGVAWAVTTSGLHLAAIVAMVGAFAGMVGCGRRGRAVATVTTLGIAVLAAGLRLSLVRAAIAAAVAMLARLVGRRRDATAALGATVLLLVALDPAASYDLGLLMGVVALIAIAAFSGLAATWLRPLAGASVSRALGASLAAQVGVAPISASMFGGVALAGPVTLALTGPLVAGAAAVGLCGAMIVPLWPGGADAVLRLAAIVAQGAAALWAFVARAPATFVASPEVPWWAWAVWILGACALWAWWPCPRRAARVRAGAMFIAIALGASIFGTVPSSARIQVLDVGQGDAVLVRDGPHTLLVDTGPDPVTLRRALARANVRSLEGLVLTHAHDDHTGGLPGLEGVARPAWIGVPDVEDDAVERLASDCAARTGTVVRLRRDMSWMVGATRVRVLWPTGGERRLDANDTSVVLLVEQEGGRALLLGDAEERAQRGVLDVWSAPVEMLKVAHHGSSNGNVPMALSAWKPRVAQISVGTGNRFGHPSATALDSLAAVGARIERTDLQGDLEWAGDGSGVAAVAAAARSPVCDNPCPKRTSLHGPGLVCGTVVAWLSENCRTSSPSTSSTVPRNCCWSAPHAGCVTGWPPWQTSTSTWRRSMAARPPPTRSSMRPTPCPS